MPPVTPGVLSLRVVLLALAMLPVDGRAQCSEICASSNWSANHYRTRLARTTVAVRVSGFTAAKTLCQLELVCFTYEPQPVSMPVWIYDLARSGGPGAVIGSGTMIVGTAVQAYSAAIQAVVPANTDFFIVFDNAIGNLAPPTSGRAISGGGDEHWHSGPPVWSGPYRTAKWMYRLRSSTGRVQSTFATVGEGCTGTAGVPGIGRIGSPVIGSDFRVTLSRAPALAPAAHVIGAIPAPVPLMLNGAPGCGLQHLPLLALPVLVDVAGTAAFRYAIPNRRSLMRSSLLVQWVVVDPAANALGVTVSAGGVATIGDF